MAELGKLPPGDQDALALLLLEEIEDRRQWDEAFAASQEQLARWAEKVRGDIATGRVTQTELFNLE